MPTFKVGLVEETSICANIYNAKGNYYKRWSAGREQRKKHLIWTFPLLILNVFLHFYFINPIQLSKPKNSKHWPLQQTISCVHWMLSPRLSIDQLLEGCFHNSELLFIYYLSYILLYIFSIVSSWFSILQFYFVLLKIRIGSFWMNAHSC